MSERDIPDGARREIERAESAEFFPVFLTLRHDGISEPIRLVSDPKDFVLDGNTHTGFMFRVDLLSDTEGMPTAQLAVQNVDRRIGEAVLAARGAPRIDMEVIAGSEFDLSADPRTELSAGNSARVYSAKSLYLTEVEADVQELRGRLRSWDYTQETWPGTRVTQDRFPGLYR